MKTYCLKRTQTLPIERDQLFSFFESPDNLEKITPSSVGFKILTPAPIEMKTGLVLDYTIKILGLPIRWTTLISSFDRPDRFVDVALRGPYAFWHHTHTFESNADGSTTMTDQVRYALGFGIFGSLVHSFFVKGQLKRIFDYRADVIHEIINSKNGIAPSNGQIELSR